MTEFEALTGSGVRAEIGGTTYYVGKPDFFADLELMGGTESPTVPDGGVMADPNPMSPATASIDREAISSLEREGKTVVLVGSDDQLFGAIALADRPRPEAQPVIEWLQARGIQTVMLTGDNEQTAQAVATQLGLDEYRAGLLPEDKLDVLDAFQTESRAVAMVGDGINDAPALTTATVGIAMGAAGTDTALETADVALMNDDLTKLPAAYLLSQRTTRVIKQNVWASLGIEGALALAAPLGLVGPIIAVLLGDAGLVLAVTMNALRVARGETHLSLSESEVPSEQCAATEAD